jgi:hypothetical protein
LRVFWGSTLNSCLPPCTAVLSVFCVYEIDWGTLLLSTII